MFKPNLEHAKQCYEIFSSPTFLTSEHGLKKQIKQLKNTFSKNVRFFYAIKANYNPFIISTLKKEGLDGIDTVSPYEIKLAKKLGFEAKDIIFTGCASDEKELKAVKDEGVLFNIGSLSELQRYAELFPDSSISLRLNPGFGEGENSKVITAGDDAKFGITLSNLEKALDLCKSYKVKIIGFHMHLGSGLYQSSIFKKALDFILPIAQKTDSIDFIDLGGGFGVRHRLDQTEVDLVSFSEVLNERLHHYKLDSIEIRFEPGKYLVAESTAFLCKVNVVKQFPSQQCLIVDSGFNHLIRPSFYESYHEIMNLSRPNENCISTKIEGYLCESGDIFHPSLNFPQSKEDDYLAILSSGAYCSSMSSLYNFRPFAAEAILKEDGSFEQCRLAQNFEDTWKQMAWLNF